MREVVGVGIERVARVLSPLSFALYRIYIWKIVTYDYYVKQSLLLFLVQDNHGFAE